jgi:hypothetical protein
MYISPANRGVNTFRIRIDLASITGHSEKLTCWADKPVRTGMYSDHCQGGRKSCDEFEVKNRYIFQAGDLCEERQLW